MAARASMRHKLARCWVTRIAGNFQLAAKVNWSSNLRKCRNLLHDWTHTMCNGLQILLVEYVA